MIRNGSYFQESRTWYQSLYIGPISERSFFLVIAGLASLVAIFSFVAVLGLVPITERPAVLVSNMRMDETVPSLARIKPESMTVNEGIMQFFVKTYVEKREGYHPLDYVRNFSFVQAHSTPGVYTGYAAAFDRTNPSSPVHVLGESGQRLVYVQDIDITQLDQPPAADPSLQQPQTYNAVVRFSTDTIGSTADTKSQWTATIQFIYSDFASTEVKDPITGKPLLETKDPVFQVVQYVVTQAF